MKTGTRFGTIRIFPGSVRCSPLPTPHSRISTRITQHLTTHTRAHARMHAPHRTSTSTSIHPYPHPTHAHRTRPCPMQVSAFGLTELLEKLGEENVLLDVEATSFEELVDEICAGLVARGVLYDGVPPPYRFFASCGLPCDLPRSHHARMLMSAAATRRAWRACSRGHRRSSTPRRHRRAARRCDGLLSLSHQRVGPGIAMHEHASLSRVGSNPILLGIPITVQHCHVCVRGSNCFMVHPLDCVRYSTPPGIRAQCNQCGTR